MQRAKDTPLLVLMLRNLPSVRAMPSTAILCVHHARSHLLYNSGSRLSMSATMLLKPACPDDTTCCLVIKIGRS